MPIVKVRSLGELGIITDVSPEDLPANAWTGGLNIRFDERGVSRAPSFRRLMAPLPVGDPETAGVSMVASNPQGSSLDRLVALDTRFEALDITSLPDISPPTVLTMPEAAATSSERPNSTNIVGVLVMNRPDRRPVHIAPGSDTFSVLPGWPVNLRARTIRSFGDNLVATNLVDGTDFLERAIHLSSFARGAVPTSWDHTDPASGSARIGVDSVDPLVDVAVLGSSLMVYSSSEGFEVTRVPGNRLYNTRRLSGNRGIFAPGCAIEVRGEHYCFGPADIVAHQSSTAPRSIISGRNKRFLYRTLINSDASQFFTFTVDGLNEVWFCYRSRYSGAKWPANLASRGCNMAAVFNWSNAQWSFVDLPYVLCATTGNANPADSWALDQDTWNASGGAWSDGDDSRRRHIMLVCNKAPLAGITQNRLVALDGFGAMSRIDRALEPELFAPAWFERMGFDVDDEGLELRAYKHLRALYPQGELPAGGVILRAGGSLAPKGVVELPDAVTAEGSEDYKYDLKTGGRLLAMRWDVPDPNDFALSGFDLDIVVLGRR